jgi:hypothetical protein
MENSDHMSPAREPMMTFDLSSLIFHQTVLEAEVLARMSSRQLQSGLGSMSDYILFQQCSNYHRVRGVPGPLSNHSGPLSNVGEKDGGSSKRTHFHSLKARIPFSKRLVAFSKRLVAFLKRTRFFCSGSSKASLSNRL